MSVTAYPLSWPAGWRRTPESMKRHAKFTGSTRVSTGDGGSYNRTRELTVAEGTQRVLDELRRFGIPDYQITLRTNLKLRRDGLPLSEQRTPDDQGAAVYWKEGAEDHCIAVDHYFRVADNLAAIAATLEAMRAIERHGGAQILKRAFIGMTAALPAPGSTRNWRDILGIETERFTELDVTTAYRSKASYMHPDKGGTPEQMADLNWAREQALKELGA